MKAGGVIACDAPRAPWPPMHPEVRRQLLDIARRLDPLVLRWGRRGSRWPKNRAQPASSAPSAPPA